MEKFIPVEIFRMKGNTIRGITFFPFLPKRPKFSIPFHLDYQCQAQSREKAKNLPVYCKWYRTTRININPWIIMIIDYNMVIIIR